MNFQKEYYTVQYTLAWDVYIDSDKVSFDTKNQAETFINSLLKEKDKTLQFLELQKHQVYWGSKKKRGNENEY